MTEKHALFITFEGGEGAGKTTLINKIEESLISQGRQVLRTREPGGTQLGERIRKVLLDKDAGVLMNEKAELLLFLAGRAQHVEEVIKPALKAGKIVLCDRFNDSTMAYQGWARGLGMDTVEGLCRFACGDLAPDLTFFLDVDPQAGLQRSQRTHKDDAPAGQVDRIEGEAIAFHQMVREGFFKLMELSPQRICVLDANQPAGEVFSGAWNRIEALL